MKVEQTNTQQEAEFRIFPDLHRLPTFIFDTGMGYRRPLFTVRVKCSGEGISPELTPRQKLALVAISEAQARVANDAVVAIKELNEKDQTRITSDFRLFAQHASTIMVSEFRPAQAKNPDGFCKPLVLKRLEELGARMPEVMAVYERAVAADDELRASIKAAVTDRANQRTSDESIEAAVQAFLGEMQSLASNTAQTVYFHYHGRSSDFVYALFYLAVSSEYPLLQGSVEGLVASFVPHKSFDGPVPDNAFREAEDQQRAVEWLREKGLSDLANTAEANRDGWQRPYADLRLRTMFRESELAELADAFHVDAEGAIPVSEVTQPSFRATRLRARLATLDLTASVVRATASPTTPAYLAGHEAIRFTPTFPCGPRSVLIATE